MGWDGLCPLRALDLVAVGVVEAPRVTLAGLLDVTWERLQSQGALDPHAVLAGLAYPVLTGQRVSCVLVRGEGNDE